MTSKIVGSLWNAPDVEIAEINGKYYALGGWNGEKYGNCWEVKDKRGYDQVDNNTYEIKPVNNQVGGDCFEIVGHEIV